MTASVKPLPVLKKRLLSTKQLKQPKIVTGAAGEQRAADFLLSRNFKILERNVRFGNCELDIVALDVKKDEIVFVEVKSRGSEQYGDPSQAVNYRKTNALRKAAAQYLGQTHLRKQYRFDVITVLPNKIEHLENITW